MDQHSYTQSADAAYIEDLYARYCSDPGSIDGSWRPFFAAYDFFLTSRGQADGLGQKELGLQRLLHAYRSRAHLLSTTNPIRPRRKHKAGLSLSDFGFQEKDLGDIFHHGAALLGVSKASLGDILGRLKEIYASTIGFEYMHIRCGDVVSWFREKAEKALPRFTLSLEKKKRILSKLNDAVVFENFLHTKYVGQKRFSLEGGETTISALDVAIQHGSLHGVRRVEIGMAHRGRLNVLANVLGKTYELIFHEFEGDISKGQTMGDGDVKYHMGYVSKVKGIGGKELDLYLAPNPSHLEVVGVVVQGSVRARIDGEYGGDSRGILPIVIHGDAAIGGQGLVYEMAQMSQLEAYNVGGTIHFVINNQVGFTTDYAHARSSIYCTDVAKITDAPVMHVNGDDPEAVAFCMQVAVEYRQTFGRDVYVDMLCYRRHGHNEGDEPKFTQPSLYSLISGHPNPREIYTERLSSRGEIEAQLAKDMDGRFRKVLQDRLKWVKETREIPYELSLMEKRWKSLRHSRPEDFEGEIRTGISLSHIEKVAAALTTLPKGFTSIKQIDRLFSHRKAMFYKEKVLNWGLAELLAYGSVLLEGHSVRLVGQDTQRGTFSHRHAVVFDSRTNAAVNSLSSLASEGQDFYIYNSLLSEYGALGFEMGYSWSTDPSGLVLWEAQFGDFANGAQVVIDQFLVASYTKWQRMSGLVLLLPHGYEGQGAEHSSARVERFLQMCSGYNMFVCNITTPANFFHMLRRQLALPFRMCCVVMSPKSLLRHPLVRSSLSDFTQGGFQEIIDDTEVDAKGVRKVLLCTGKIYYDLYKVRAEKKIGDVALVRLEQLYPLSRVRLRKILSRYGGRKSLVFVQEESNNMGAWSYLLRTIGREFSLEVVSRKASASPATGFYKTHVEEQAQLLEEALRV